ncbi:hypothetical protein PR048_032576 [Dryococelus australis]|uniref:Uncharacterized protein n=1 Tax=Dryococelus australis TaxID=614101 RepID=A0ABQ9G2K4_9NEOP|nr:hypothetical protein PR048_032576 [Dryococelus australis]
MQVGPPSGSDKVKKGGSYLCHKNYCYRTAVLLAVRTLQIARRATWGSAALRLACPSTYSCTAKFLPQKCCWTFLFLPSD